jgi:iron(III) transport system substrate-binding protein
MKNTPFFIKLLFLMIICLTSTSCSYQIVVVACAQDREYAEQLFDEYRASRSIKTEVKYDTEANKSVGLANELIAEMRRPRCDVHWNNEILATIRLARKGVYEQYSSENAKDYPNWTQGKHWQAFASRARVLIVNNNLVGKTEFPKSVLELIDPRWKGKIAIAKPLFGTTATQAACLFEVLGQEKAKEFYRGLKKNDVHVVAGNKQVAVGVAEGKFAVGFTDSDDAIVEYNRGKPVTIIYPDHDEKNDSKMGVLFIPNTLALVKNSPNPKEGKKLIDYLLSAEVEMKLALGGGFQIPLNSKHDPAKLSELHACLPRPGSVKAMTVDFEKAADLWEESQTFLRNEFLGE